MGARASLGSEQERPLSWRGIVSLAAALVLVCGGAGCGGKERVRCYPVRGEFYWEGKPAAGAVVFFHPLESLGASNEAPAAGVRPVGRVREDGSFEVSTYGTNDGAPVGRYRLSLVWTKNTSKRTDDEEFLLPVELMDPHKAKLPIVEVKAEPNVLPALRLAP
jgi:hypothetical protein